MEIVHGLFDHMVLQRTGQDMSDARFDGSCTQAGAVVAWVTGPNGLVAGCDGVTVGMAVGGAFSGRLTGIPVGGPYVIELQVGTESLRVWDVLVGDVWILAGQSNMQGCGCLSEAAQPDPQVRAFYMNDCWGTAQDPLHNLWDAVDRVHADLSGGANPPVNNLKGVGPGVAFGQEMQRITGVPQGLIACAHGGTSMSQWDPALKRRRGGSLYGAMLRRVRKNGMAVAGVVWYQGCSDANATAAPQYTERMKAFVRSVRKDLGQPNLPFATVQIGRVYAWSTAEPWNQIQEQQRQLPKVIKHLVVVPAIDLALEDPIHISGADQQRLGRRLGQAMAVLSGRLPDQLPPISLKRVSVAVNPISGAADIIAEYDNVVGALVAAGRAQGFWVDDGTQFPGHFRVDLDGNRAILRTFIPMLDVEGKDLWYGKGMFPYCNITDRADRALPVFGPLRIGAVKAVTPFVRQWHISTLQPSVRKLTKLAYPDHLTDGDWQAQRFETDFCDLHLALEQSKRSQLIYCVGRFTCPTPMRLQALLGYDGPVKVWIDRKPVFVDPAGCNPATPDAKQLSFTADAGEHEIVVALDSNKGHAWGIFLRLLRRDVSAAAIKKGGYAMPEFIG